MDHPGAAQPLCCHSPPTLGGRDSHGPEAMLFRVSLKILRTVYQRIGRHGIQSRVPARAV
jgi:hypothetical protein